MADTGAGKPEGEQVRQQSADETAAATDNKPNPSIGSADPTSGAKWSAALAVTETLLPGVLAAPQLRKESIVPSTASSIAAAEASAASSTARIAGFTGQSSSAERLVTDSSKGGGVSSITVSAGKGADPSAASLDNKTGSGKVLQPTGSQLPTAITAGLSATKSGQATGSGTDAAKTAAALVAGVMAAAGPGPSVKAPLAAASKAGTASALPELDRPLQQKLSAGRPPTTVPPASVTASTGDASAAVAAAAPVAGSIPLHAVLPHLSSGPPLMLQLPSPNPAAEAEAGPRDTDGNTKLHLAAGAGDLKTVHDLLKAGADLNVRNSRRCTPLHLAAEAGRLDVVQLLVQAPGCQAHALDCDSQSPLVTAVHAGCLEVVNFLGEDRSSMHHKLQWAAQHGHLQVLKELLDCGAPVNLTCEAGWTPLHRSCISGHLSIAQELVVSRKANILAATKDGRTPILLAAQGGNADIVKLLLEHASRLPQDYKTKEGWPSNLLQHKTRNPADPKDPGLNLLLLGAKHGHAAVVKVAIQHRANLHSVDIYGRSALHHACLGGSTAHLAVVRVLIDAAITKDILDHSGRTPLLLAYKHQEFCEKPDTCKHHEMVQVLRSAGAAMHFHLHLAAQEGLIEVVREELNCRCELCVEEGCCKLADHRGWTALHSAAQYGHSEVVAELIKAGADVNATNHNGVTPLMLASKGGHASVVKLLLENAASVWLRTEDKRTALHKVCNRKQRGKTKNKQHAGHVEVVKLLLAAILKLREAPVQIEEKFSLGYGGVTMGATMGTMGVTMSAAAAQPKVVTVDDKTVINWQDNKDYTAVGMAAFNGAIEVVALLLRQGRADINLADVNGYLPIHKAAMEGHLPIVKELVAGGSPVRPQNNEGCAPLHYAARGGHLAIVQYLLAARVRSAEDTEESLVDMGTAKGVTPLMMAAEKGRLEVVRDLLERKADPTHRDAGENTALHFAAQHGHLDVLNVLMGHEKVTSFGQNMAGATPIHLVVDNDKVPEERCLLVVKELVDFEKDEEVQRKLVNATNKLSVTALRLAVDKERTSVMLYLLNKGAIVDLSDINDFTCLHAAAATGNLDIVNLLIENSGHSLVYRKDWLGNTCMHVAIQYGSLEALRNLVNRDRQDPNTDGLHIQNKQGYCPVHATARWGRLLILRMLQDEFDDEIEMMTPNGRTPLHVAAAFGQPEVVNFLLESNCDMNLTYKPPAPKKGSKPKRVRWAYDSDRCAVHGGYKRICPAVEEDNAETEIVPACVVSPLPPALGFSYFEVTIGDVEREVVQVQQAVKSSSPGAGTSSGQTAIAAAGGAVAGANAGAAAAGAGGTTGAAGQKGATAASGATGAAASGSTAAKPADGQKKPEVPSGGVKYEPPNISVGLGMDKATYDVPPGLRENTFGYSSINGYKYSGTVSSGRQYGPKFQEGDTIGVIFNRAYRSISFTKNGQHLGAAVRDKDFPDNINPDDICAMVGWRTTGIKEITCNFGIDPDMPFVANVDDLLIEEESLNNPGDKEPWRMKDKIHPIHLACCSKNTQVLELLLKNGANLWQRDADDWLAIHFAALVGWDQGIQMLLKHFRDRIKAMNAGKPAKPAAAGPAGEVGPAKHAPEQAVGGDKGGPGSARFVDARTRYGSTPLLFAIKNSHSEATRTLIENGGADCSVTDKQGRTLLMWAAATGNVEIMNLLIHQGVAVKTKDYLGRTAMQYASNEAAADFLEKRANQTIPYDGREYLQLRVDTEVKKGAVGHVVMAKATSSGDPLAIKFHATASNRDISFEVLKKLVNKVSRQYLVAPPAGLTDAEVKFDDFKRDPSHPYALVMEGGDTSLQDVLDEIGPAGFCSPIPENQSRFIFENLVQALHCMHSHGYTHHDVKAKNFVRFFNGHYKLIDFDNSRCFADEQEMGFTSAEICPPEVAKCMLGRGKLLKSEPSMDMWALGCVLYQLTTHRYLLPDVARWDQDEVYKRPNEEALEAWKSVDEKQVRKLLDEQVKGGADNPAHELLMGLLKANPKQRFTINDVTASTFLTGGAALSTILGETKRLNVKMDLVASGISDLKERLVKLEDLPAQVREGFKNVGSQISSFRKMVLQVHKAECPGTFVIGPEISTAEALQLAAGGGGQAKEGLSQWTDGLAAIFKGEMGMGEFADRLTQQRFKLRLVCESCGEPQGEGYSVKQPKEWVTAMLPAMKVSLTVVKIANIGMGIAGCFFPGIPTIPDEVLAKGDDILSGLDHKSSAEDFACIQGALDSKATGGGADDFQKQVDAGLRQLHVFLDTADPTHTWGGLALVDMGNELATDAAAAAGGGRKSVVSGSKPAPGKGGDDAASELPDSVLWVCKDCLMGKCGTGDGCGTAPAAKGTAATAGKRADSIRYRSNNGMTGSPEEIIALKEGIKSRDIAVRLLVRELRNAGLPLPALPAGVPVSYRLTSEGGGTGGQIIGLLTGSFKAGSAFGPGLNDTANFSMRQRLGGANAGKGSVGAAADAVATSRADNKVPVASGGSCLWFRGSASVHPEV